ncbi:MAG: hypothetical protein AAB372_02985 [Patescibacteria group bacterium]
MNKILYTKGQAALMAVLFFFFISLLILGAYGYIAVTELNRARELAYAKKSFITAESGIEEVASRIQNTQTYATPESVTLNSATASVTISGTGPYTLVSRSNLSNRHRSARIVFDGGSLDGGFPDLNNAAQIGFLTVRVNDSPTVRSVNIGESTTFYSNSTIDASGATAPVVYGDIMVANSIAASSTWAQCNPKENGNCVNKPSDNWASWDSITVKLGTVGKKDMAQAFVPAVTAYAMRACVYLKKVGTPPALQLTIEPNDPVGASVASSTATRGGSPYDANDSSYHTNQLKTLNASNATTNFEWKCFDFLTDYSSDFPMVEGEKYWLVLSLTGSGGDASNHWVFMSKNNSYVPQGITIPNHINYPACYGDSCGSTPDQTYGTAEWHAPALKFAVDAELRQEAAGWDTLTSTRSIAFKIFQGEETKDSASNTRFLTRSMSMDTQRVAATDGLLKAQQVEGNAGQLASTTGAFHYGYARTDVRYPPQPYGATQDCADGPSPSTTYCKKYCDNTMSVAAECVNSSPYPAPATSTVPASGTGPFASGPGILPMLFTPEGDGNSPKTLIKTWKTTADGYNVTTPVAEGTNISIAGSATTTIQPGKYGSLTISGNGKLILSVPANQEPIFYFTGAANISCTSAQKCGIYLDKPGNTTPDPVFAAVLFDGTVSVTNSGPEIIGCNPSSYAGCKNSYLTRNPAYKDDVYLYSLQNSFNTLSSNEVFTMDNPAIAKLRGSVFVPFGRLLINDNPLLSQVVAAGLEIRDKSVLTYRKGAACLSCTPSSANLDITEFHEIE